jgi:hypothetical protein
MWLASPSHPLLSSCLHDTASNIYHHHRIEPSYVTIFYLYSAQHASMPAVRPPDPALFTGLEAVSGRPSGVDIDLHERQSAYLCQRQTHTFLSSFSIVQFPLTLSSSSNTSCYVEKCSSKKENGVHLWKTVPHALPIVTWIPHTNPTAHLRLRHLRKHSRRLPSP